MTGLAASVSPAASPSQEFSSLIRLLQRPALDTPDGTATFHRHGSGEWKATSWRELWNEVQQSAAMFRSLGLTKGDRLAILARSCREWQIAELGAFVLGASVVGVDPHAALEQVGWFLMDAGAVGLVVDGPAELQKVPERAFQRLKFVLTLQQIQNTRSDLVRPWHETIRSTPLPTQTWGAEVAPDDLAVLIYTSGTSGTPKGVEYSHRDILTACQSFLDEFLDFRECRLVCWLPMSAMFQRMMNLSAFASRSVTYFVEDPKEVVPLLPQIRPTIFTSVPRFYEKVYEAITERVRTLPAFEQRLVRRALVVGARWAQCVRSGKAPGLWLRVQHRLLDRIVLQRMRGIMGGEIKWMVTGSAVAPVWLLEFFSSIGLLLLEAYGISENPVPIAANRANAYRFGSVGKPFKVNQVRIAENGEVLVNGPALFHAYKDEDQDPSRFTADGYYRTGDLGRLDEDGYLYLTGRVSEIIKTSGGRRISPSAVEAIYRESRFVEQMVVVGNDRPYLVALVVPTPAAADQGGVPLLKEDLERLGERLASYERVRAFAIVAGGFSLADGEVTSTLKLRRDRIESRHAAVIDALFRGEGERLGPA